MIAMNNLSIFILLLVIPISISVAAEPPESAKPFVSGARLDHVGVAVRDLDRTRADYQTLGFQVQPGGHFPGGASNANVRHDLVGALAAMPEQGFGNPGRSVSFDGLEGRATRAGTGDLDLVKTAGEPGDPNDYRILGVTLIVSDFEKTRGAVEAATRMRLRVYRGAYGRSATLPVGLTHGLRVELVAQHPVNASTSISARRR
jgi:catechol 2,3-dioxygenase-like lactoylglutathione lyase family enzyme